MARRSKQSANSNDWDEYKKVDNKRNKNSKNHSSEEYKKKQSEVMKKAWAKRKANS